MLSSAGPPVNDRPTYAIPAQGQGVISRMPCWSDGDGKVIEGDAEPVAAGDAGGDVVVATAQVLREGVTGGEAPGSAATLQPAHRPQPGFQPSVACLDQVVRLVPAGL